LTINDHLYILSGACGCRYDLHNGVGDRKSLLGRLSSVRSFRHDGRQATSSLLRCSRSHVLRSLQRPQILRVQNRGLRTARHAHVAYHELLLQGINDDHMLLARTVHEQNESLLIQVSTKKPRCFKSCAQRRRESKGYKTESCGFAKDIGKFTIYDYGCSKFWQFS